MDAAIWGTRAAVIGGANGTSNVRAGKLFDIPVLGTHAHALVQVYGNDFASDSEVAFMSSGSLKKTIRISPEEKTEKHMLFHFNHPFRFSFSLHRLR